MCEFVVGYPYGRPRTPQHKDVCVGLLYAVCQLLLKMYRQVSATVVGLVITINKGNLHVTTGSMSSMAD